jgi:DNA polymerase-3 subunit beta
MRSVGFVSHVAGRGGSLPILSNVLVRAEAGALVLSATNLELAVQSTIRGKVDAEGSTTINARILAEYVNLLPPDGTVSLELSGDTVSIAADSVQTSLQALPAGDYPVIPEVQGEPSMTVNADALRRSLSQVLFAVSNDETRPEINGVLLSIQEGRAVLASTDSYRLAESVVSLDGPARAGEKIIPWRTLQEVVRCFGGGGDVSVRFGEGQVSFTGSDVSVVSRLVEGQYPSYQPIIPTTHVARCTVESATLTRLVKQASLFCKPGVNDVRVSVDGATITVGASNASVGEHHGSAEVKAEGQPCGALFNYRYILEGIAAIGAPSVTLSLTGELTPALLQAEGQTSYRYVVMPIQP